MAEPVAVVLAIAPLIISAIENYQTTAECIRGFRKYTKCVKVHVKVLHIQEVIFLNANNRLLSECVGEDLAYQMLADLDHREWREDVTASLYLERLGCSHSSFKDAIEVIRDELAALRKVLDDLDFSEEEGVSLKKKVKYTLKQSSIESSLNSLREKTRDFVSLLDSSPSLRHNGWQHRSCLASRKQISHFANIQETAGDLYEALGQACTKHGCHQAQLSLQPVHAEPTQIRFTIAFSQLTLESTLDAKRSFSGPTWLNVESRVTGILRKTNDKHVIGQEQNCLKRTVEHLDLASFSFKPSPKTIQGKRVRILEPVNELKIGMPMQPSSPELTNLCTSSNFCNRLQKFLAEARPSNTAVGYLEVHGSAKHLVYVDSRSQSVSSTPTTMRLKPLHNILMVRRRAYGQLFADFHIQKLVLARQLATAILQFSATPWLQESWDSSNILVSETQAIEPENGIPPLEMYLSAELHSPLARLKRQQTMPNPVVVRNPLLFRLGILLIEIAYQRPLSTLIIERDRDRTNTKNTEYFAAVRLSKRLSSVMGFRYAEIVRKCIHCDFGCDFDLGLSKLKERFYEDVVCELESLEHQMRNM